MQRLLVLASSLFPLSTTALAGSSTRTALLEGELLFYPSGVSELPQGTQITVAGPRRSLGVRALATATLDGGRLQALASEELSHGTARVGLERAGEAALDLSRLYLLLADGRWTLHGGEGDLLGKPLFWAEAHGAVRALSSDEFHLHVELLLDPAFATELGLDSIAGAVIGALTLTGSSQRSNEFAAQAPQAFGTSAALVVPGPDVIVSTIGSSLQKYGSVGGTTAYAVTTVSCNIGTADAIWIDCTTGGATCNQHPVIGQTLYRLKTVAGSKRFEELGLSWLKHGFCGADAQSQATCTGTYVPNASCDWLGLFATDTYGSGLNGSQSNLGPRSDINAWTGVFPYPYTINWTQTGDAIFKRLQVASADLDPAQNTGAQYVAEVQYICTDEPSGNRYNNVSYRSVALGAQTNTPPGSDLTFNATTVQQQPAIQFWAANEAGVTITPIDVAGDGRLYLAHKVTSLGLGQYHYEYALYNMNCDASVQALAVPFPGSATLANIGFHDVPYHSGEPYSGSDWTPVTSGGSLRWSTQTLAQNVNANALRWSSTYNFRFDADAAPTPGTLALTLFKTGLVIPVAALVPSNSGGGAISSFCLPGVAGVLACPCGNPALGGSTGCDNSSSTGGALLSPGGSAALSNDSLVLTSFGEKPGATSSVLQGDATNAAGTVFGMGVRCVDGNLLRLYTKTAAGGSISAPQGADPSLSARSAALGDSIPPGSSRYYAVAYRDPTPLGACPALGTFNITQQLDVTWNP